MHEDGVDDGSKPLVNGLERRSDAHPTSFPDDDADDHGAGGAKAIRAPSGGLLSFLGRKKGLEAILREAAKENEGDAGENKLSLFDLLCVGIGGTVGSGVFVLTGNVMQYAGPAATLSWAFAGLVCLLSACSYMELSARIPTAGSCYIFAYHALGELPAVVGATCLTLEYGLSGAGVARNWSDKLVSLLGLSNTALVTYYRTPRDDTDDDYYLDYPAAVLQILCVAICVAGLRIGKQVINVFTIAKCALVVFMIICGFACWDQNIFDSSESFAPDGISGIVTGSSLLFFGFIGFDEVCCLAAKSHNPRRTMPLAIAGTLGGSALLSMLAQLALSGMTPYTDDMGAVSFEDSFKDHVWPVASGITAVGEVLLLPLVVLVCFLPQPELFAAMSEDKLIPSIFHQRDSSGTFVWGCIVSGAVMTGFSLCVPFVVLWDMISLGVLLGFNLTNTALIMLRYGNGGCEAQPLVTRWVAVLWLFGGAGAYTFWLGFASPALDGKEWSVPLLAVGLACLAVAGLSLFSIATHGRLVAEVEEPVTTFRAPLVPFLPGAAIVLNFALMAQFSFVDHCYLIGLVLAITTCYIGHKLAKRGDRGDVGASGDIQSPLTPHHVY